MDKCCADTLIKMQEEVRAGDWLKMFLFASPFLMIIPDLIPPRSAKEAAEVVLEKMAVMTADKALSNIQKGKSKPDFVDAIRAVDVMVCNNLQRIAGQHGLFSHRGTRDGQVWINLAAAYNKKVVEGARGGNGQKEEESSWLPWLW